MYRYIGSVFLSAFCLLVAAISIVLYVPAPILAEYWDRELFVIKQHMLQESVPPRIIILGGSSSLFGIDAHQISREIGIPAINMGWHAGLRLERIADAYLPFAKSGDIVVLALEPTFYGCEKFDAWDSWQVTNAVAWDHRYFDRLPMTERIRAIAFSGGPELVFNIIAAKTLEVVAPRLVSQRLMAMAPPDEIWKRFQSGALRTSTFAYSAYNLDQWGDMTNIGGSQFFSAGIPVDQPSSLCHKSQDYLTAFVRGLHRKGVTVFVAHTPYLVDGAPPHGWQGAERMFRDAIHETGAQLVDRREDLFLPRKYFFNSALHLNEDGRAVRTTRLIVDLRRLGVGTSPRLRR